VIKTNQAGEKKPALAMLKQVRHALAEFIKRPQADAQIGAINRD